MHPDLKLKSERTVRYIRVAFMFPYFAYLSCCCTGSRVLLRGQKRFSCFASWSEKLLVSCFVARKASRVLLRAHRSFSCLVLWLNLFVAFEAVNSCSSVTSWRRTDVRHFDDMQNRNWHDGGYRIIVLKKNAMKIKSNWLNTNLDSKA